MFRIDSMQCRPKRTSSRNEKKFRRERKRTLKSNVQNKNTLISVEHDGISGEKKRNFLYTPNIPSFMMHLNCPFVQTEAWSRTGYWEIIMQSLHSRPKREKTTTSRLSLRKSILPRRHFDPRLQHQRRHIRHLQRCQRRQIDRRRGNGRRVGRRRHFPRRILQVRLLLVLPQTLGQYVVFQFQRLQFVK